MANQTSPIYAVIDIGTNSTRLLLARFEEGRVQVVEKRLIATRIGERMSRDGTLTEEGMERTIKALESYVGIARGVEAEEIYVFATSAVREATNRDELLARCRQRFWISIDVIDGNTEALISYLGAAPMQGECRVLDLGGGSTEMCTGRDGELILMGSIPMGAVRAKEQFTPDEKGLKQLYRSVAKQRLEVQQKEQGEMKVQQVVARDFLARSKKSKAPLYGVGGTITTLCALSDGLSVRYDPRTVHGRTMTRGEVELVLREFQQMSEEKRKSIPLLEGREDILQYGATILMACMDGMSATSLIVSDSDNLEGYLVHQMKRKTAQKKNENPSPTTEGDSAEGDAQPAAPPISVEGHKDASLHTDTFVVVPHSNRLQSVRDASIPDPLVNTDGRCT